MLIWTLGYICLFQFWFWGRLSYLSLLFFGTPHSNGYIFPFLLCFSLLFFSQWFVRHPQTIILLFCISFSWGWSWFLSPVQCHKPLSIVHRALCLSLFLVSRSNFEEVQFIQKEKILLLVHFLSCLWNFYPKVTKTFTFLLEALWFWFLYFKV